MRAVFVMPVEDEEAVECEIQRETDGDYGSYKRWRMGLPYEVDGLGHEVEKGGADNGSGTEPEYEVKAILEMQRKPPAEECRAECGDADENDHGFF